MKATQAEERALISLLNSIYLEIRALEEEYGLRAAKDDLRARIEYFHDALRAMTGNPNAARLSVEFLAYDIEMLRYIQASPLTGLKGTNLPLPATIKVDSKIKSRLSDLYKHYSVLFVALLSDTAERNYRDRIEERNEEVEALAMLEKAAGVQKRGEEVDIEALAERYVAEPKALYAILARLRARRPAKRMPPREASRTLKALMAAADKEIKAVEQAHFTYATGQLAIYEGARDVVKKMAIKGLNIVGDFVENAVRDAVRAGRGL